MVFDEGTVCCSVPCNIWASVSGLCDQLVAGKIGATTSLKRIGPRAVGCSLKLRFVGGLLIEMGKFAPHKCF